MAKHSPKYERDQHAYADVPLFTFQIQTGFFVWLSQNSRIIVATILPLLMTAGIISVINNVLDIMRMRGRLETM